MCGFTSLPRVRNKGVAAGFILNEAGFQDCVGVEPLVQFSDCVGVQVDPDPCPN